jgi:hypothetical protein
LLGELFYQFPAVVELIGLGAISDVLVGRRKWDSPTVLRDRDILLGPDQEAAERYIQAWRERAVLTFQDTWEETKAFERNAFGDRSFFYCQEQGIKDLPEDDPSPSPSEWRDDHDPTAQYVSGSEGEEEGQQEAAGRSGSGSQRKADSSCSHNEELRRSSRLRQQ